MGASSPGGDSLLGDLPLELTAAEGLELVEDEDYVSKASRLCNVFKCCCGPCYAIC